MRTATIALHIAAIVLASPGVILLTSPLTWGGWVFCVAGACVNYHLDRSLNNRNGA